jgi:hypothetical protein
MGGDVVGVTASRSFYVHAADVMIADSAVHQQMHGTPCLSAGYHTRCAVNRIIVHRHYHSSGQHKDGGVAAETSCKKKLWNIELAAHYRL